MDPNAEDPTLSPNEVLITSSALFLLLYSSVFETPVTFLRDYLWHCDRNAYIPKHIAAFIWTVALAAATPKRGTNVLLYFSLLLILAVLFLLTNMGFNLVASAIDSRNLQLGLGRPERLESLTRITRLYPMIRFLGFVLLGAQLTSWWLLEEFHNRTAVGVLATVVISIFFIIESFLETYLFLIPRDLWTWTPAKKTT